MIGTQMITPVSVEKNPGKSRKQIKSDRTSDETSADDVNKKVSDPSAETEEVKAPADIQVKVSEEHKMYRKALTRAWKRLGYSDELAELRTRSSVQVRRANWSGLQNRYETVSSAEKRKPALISWWVMSG